MPLEDDDMDYGTVQGSETFDPPKSYGQHLYEISDRTASEKSVSTREVEMIDSQATTLESSRLSPVRE